MIREYLILRKQAVDIIDTAQRMFEYLDENYKIDSELHDLFKEFDHAVNKINL